MGRRAARRGRLDAPALVRSHCGSRQRRRSRSAVEDVHCRRELGVPARVTRIAWRVSRGSDERRRPCRSITDVPCDWRCPAGTAAPGSSGWTRFGSSMRRNLPRARCGSSRRERTRPPSTISRETTRRRSSRRRPRRFASRSVVGATGLEYRVVGIVWGGARAIDRLAIRFSDDEPWKPFDLCPAPRRRGDLVAVDATAGSPPLRVCTASR